MSDLLDPQGVQEVRAWKAAIQRKYADLPLKEALSKMQEDAERIIAERGIDLPRCPAARRTPKVAPSP